MSLFHPEGRAPAQAGQFDPRKKLQEMQAHPSAVLAQAGFSVPEDMTDPQRIINHLLETGQIDQNGFTSAMRTLAGFGRPRVPGRRK